MRGGAGGTDSRGGPGATDAVAVPLSIADTWRSEAAADLALPASQLVVLVLGDLFGNIGASNLANGGTRAVAASSHGLILGAGGAANGTAWVRFDALGSTFCPLWVAAGASSKWWMKVRMAVNSGAGGPVGAATVVGGMFKSSGAIDGSHELVVGVDGAVSTTNFVVSATAGATIDSGVAIDSLVRDHKVWRDGINSYYKIDSNSAVVGTARPAASGMAVVGAFDTAAVNQLCAFNVAAIAFPARALGA